MDKDDVDVDDDDDDDDDDDAGEFLGASPQWLWFASVMISVWGMEYTEDPATMKQWAPLMMEGRNGEERQNSSKRAILRKYWHKILDVLISDMTQFGSQSFDPWAVGVLMELCCRYSVRESCGGVPSLVCPMALTWTSVNWPRQRFRGVFICGQPNAIHHPKNNHKEVM